MNRVGLGFDSHVFAEGRPLVLGGLTIPNAKGLAGHSDADVIAHAVADALLGAAGLGDLGDSFPATERWKDANSIAILRECATIVRASGWSVINVDATVIAETPKLAPFRADMARNLAGALDISPDSVSIKATTTDGMGALGREEGIGAVAVVLLDRP
ncbi:MAG: 2-C-methyl-D-erythritol 2,4-cyclodiphosphate synthase [Actinomycetota bacterium]